MKDDIFNGLNKQQKEAVRYVDGPSVILAGAGSGKTRVLVHKVLNLVLHHKVPSTSVVMITFTNKAANEMKERIQHHLGGTKVGLGYVGTFHSFCALVLRRDGQHLGIDSSFVIYDDDDQEALMKQILKEIGGGGKHTPRYFLNRISEAKNQLITPERYLELFSFYTAAKVAEVYAAYQKELNRNKALDFDDLLMKVVELFTKHKPVLEKYQDRYRYVLVDEFQDTNYAQYILTRQLGEKYHNVTVVGDFAQSIYSWRGADIRNLEKFTSEFPETKVFNLEQNYRSTQTILDFAYQVISQNQMHPILKLKTANFKGKDVTIYEAETEEDEAIFVARTIEELRTPLDQCAVLYRTNAQSRAIEEVFLHYSIPYVLIGGTRFYQRKEIKDVVSYLRLLLNPVDAVALQRVRSFGKQRWEHFKTLYMSVKDQVDTLKTVELIERVFDATGYLDQYDSEIADDFARLENIKELKSVAVTFPRLVEFLEQVALVESEYSQGERDGNQKDGVRLMTLHQAKGLEFDHVFIVGVEEGILPHSRAIYDTYQLEEERRLFYVGITRARERLYISYARYRLLYGRRSGGTKSRFLMQEGEEEKDIVYF